MKRFPKKTYRNEHLATECDTTKFPFGEWWHTYDSSTSDGKYSNVSIRSDGCVRQYVKPSEIVAGVLYSHVAVEGATWVEIKKGGMTTVYTTGTWWGDVDRSKEGPHQVILCGEMLSREGTA